MVTTLFSYYEQDAFLQRRNPAIKLAISLGLMFVATALFDAWTLALITLIVVIATWRLGQVPLSALLRGMLPFLLLGLGYLWMNVLFPRAGDAPVTVLWRLGPLRVVAEGIETGITLTARALCFGASSLFFVTTTAPADFILSLIHQFRLNPRVAYGILAAYRFLPLLDTELTQIRAAHRLRGVGEGQGVRGKVQQIHRYTIPLLASAIRKADRVSLAMESRGFGGTRPRSYYRVLRTDGSDWLLALAAILALTVILWTSWQLGLIRTWHGGLGY